jgi:hypothetical protein
MSDRIALTKLQQAKDPINSPYGAKVSKPELEGVLAEFKAADGETGKPANKFSQTALDTLIALQGTPVGGLTGTVRRLLPSLIEEAKRNLWQPQPPPGDNRVVDLAVKDGHSVFLTTQKGFAVDKQGTMPADASALGKALFHAGEWVQASFGSADNMFTKLDDAGRRAVLTQFGQQVDSALPGLQQGQKDQILGNIAGLLVELIKSVDIGMRVPVPRPEDRATIDAAFALLDKVLKDDRLSVLIKRQLVGYLAESNSFKSQLTAPQKKIIDDRHAELNPEKPFDYEAWDRAGKSTIKVDHLAGLGEGFLYGFTKWLTEKGLGNANWQDGTNKLQIIRGNNNDDSTPRTLKVTVPANDPINAWGRDMTVEIELSSFRDNMLRGLGREEVDITGYDGHSGFARNTLKSLPNAPQQKGDKLFYRFVCAGVDVENGIAHHAPKAFANSYTTQDSGYFRKEEGGPGGMEYAKEAEGWLAIRCMIRGVLGKKTHKQIQADMKDHANWWGHSAGNDNNFVGPGDPRRGGSGDWDNDGIPNMYDVMPTANLFDIAESVAKEFELKLPDVPADQISGQRAFQAIQFVDTATNYSTLLKDYNLNRRMNAHPQGVWFDGAEDPNTYVRFEKNRDGKLYVQFNSALADMTMETLRAVAFYEASNYLLTENRHYEVRDHASKIAANLLFTTAALEFDMSWRDEAVFEGLRKLYNIPESVSFGDFHSAIFAAEERHNYTGDGEALRTVLERHRAALSDPNVGKPSVRVQ